MQNKIKRSEGCVGLGKGTGNRKKHDKGFGRKEEKLIGKGKKRNC
jgi:hypothetical protein